MADSNIQLVQKIDFDRLAALVAERINALKLYAQTVAVGSSEDVHDAICRDLIIPCVGLLTQFLESVEIDEAENEE